MHLRIADHIRMQIERGDLRPGDSLPTLGDLCEQWGCSMSSARGAIALLRTQGLISGGRGKAPMVRLAPKKAIRSSDRHQLEKDLAVRPERDRRSIGEAETNLGMSLDDQDFTARYDLIEAGPELAAIFGIDPATQVQRRRFTATARGSGHLLSNSTAYIPLEIVAPNPALLDDRNEPWPGGTQHQFFTLGVEIMLVVDEVTARMPTTVEAQQWNLPDGVPLLLCRRISSDAQHRVIEVSDAEYPADRTELRFTTPLKPWPKQRTPRPGGTRAKP